MKSAPKQTRLPVGSTCLLLGLLATALFLLLHLEFFALLSSLMLGLYLVASLVGRLSIRGLQAEISLSSQRIRAGEAIEAYLDLRNRNWLLPIYSPEIALKENGIRRLQTFRIPKVIRPRQRIKQTIYPTINTRGRQRLLLQFARSSFPFQLFSSACRLNGQSKPTIVWPASEPTAARKPATADPAAQVQDEQEAISLSALSKRLGVAHQSITARRKRGDFGHWIQSLDPAGYAWSYCDRSNTYRRAIA